MFTFLSQIASTSLQNIWWIVGFASIMIGAHAQSNGSSQKSIIFGQQLAKFGIFLVGFLTFDFYIGFGAVLAKVGLGSLWQTLTASPHLLLAAKAIALLAVLNSFGLLRILLTTLYGEFTSEELLKFGLLAATLFLIIGGYWTLRSMKDSFFATLVGMKYVPWAKLGTLLAIIPIVALYNKLVDLVEREKLFWILCSVYASIFALMGILYNNGAPLITAPIPGLPGNALGWIAFVCIETFGGIIVALFWSYANSTTSTELSKRGYPLVYIAAQAGNFAGPTVVRNAEVLGFSRILYITAIALMAVPVLIQFYRSSVPSKLLSTDTDGSGKDVKKKKTGALEGLRLIGRHKYLMGLAFTSTIYEVVGTIMDMQFKLLASQEYAKEALAAYLASYGQMTAIVGFTFAVLGTSFVIRKLGVRLSLLLYPTLLGCVVLLVRTSPSLSVLFIGMVIVKMLSYTLNNPLKELMYIPTTKDVKFKVKSVIDAFGGKLSKGMGSGINAFFAGNFHSLMVWGSLISFGIVGVWIAIAIFVGSTYDRLIEEKEVIG